MKRGLEAGWIAAVGCVLLAGVARAAERPKITGISHLSVYSTDPEKAERYYVHDLGATKRADPQNAKGFRYYFNAVQFVEVLPLPGSAGEVNRMDHVAYNTVNAEGMRTYLASKGIEVPAKTTRGSDGSDFFEVRDPEGNRVEFVQTPARPEAVPKSLPSGHIIHVGYLVHMAEAEDRFYREALGFRPYWHGGKTDDVTDWVSQQVPEGTDWIEYMLVRSPEPKGIPASMTKDSLGVLDHFALGVGNMEAAVTALYVGDRLTGKHSPMQIGRDGKWQYNLFDPDGIRAELMEFQPVAKPCCSAFTAASPTE